MARARAEDHVEREPKTRSDKARSLKNAQGTGQVAEPELIDKGQCKHRVDKNQSQGVEKP